MNGKNIETEMESKKVRELASQIMSNNPRLSLSELRKALDKNSCVLEEVVEVKLEENKILNQVMEEFENKKDSTFTKSELMKVLEKVGSKNGVPSDKVASLASAAYALADPAKTGEFDRKALRTALKGSIE